MASFSQFFTSVKKTPQPRQITWVCGTEHVLVQEVVQYVSGAVNATPWNVVHLTMGVDSERSLWAAMDQHPLGGSPKLVVVNNVERIQKWDRFIEWVKDRNKNPRTFVVLVSNEERVPKTEPTPMERRKGEKPVPLPHIACIGSRGHVVECRPFTTATAPKSLEWVKAKAPMRDHVAKHLLTRANWDLRLVRDTCVKLSAFPGEVTISVVNALMAEQPRDTFPDALLSLDRRTAFLAAKSIPVEEYPRILGLLDAKLDKAGMIHDMQRDHRTSGEMAKELGAMAFLLGDLLKVAKHYDAKRRLAIRRVLAVADEAVRAGHTTGVLELVIALW